MRSIGEKCAVFGIFGKDLDVSRLTFFGLYALQHRGQESSGIASTDGNEIFCHKDIGLVAQVFNEDIIKKLPGHIAIGHNRYSTSSGLGIEHVHPIQVPDGSISLVHNGNLPSVTLLREFLAERNIHMPDASDSTLITYALYCVLKEGNKKIESNDAGDADKSADHAAADQQAKAEMKLEDAVEKIFPLLTGSFSILIMDKKSLVAVRDEYGIRPLSLAKLNGGYVIASETCAFHPIGAQHIREILPGEMVVINEDGLTSKQIVEGKQKLDIFEFVYFSRPDSELLGKSVYEVRKNFGKQLAEEFPIKADMVIPVPETAIPVAIGYANASGIPFEMGLIKSRYIHRTFIEPEQHIRDQGVKLKLAPLEGTIKGKKVIVIDDSIVRGTTSRQIVKILFEAGAKEVHFLSSSPPVKYPDFYGIDLPKKESLLAARMSVAETNAFLGSTSLNYLSYEGMIKATGIDESQFCTACFNGKYPIDLRERWDEAGL